MSANAFPPPLILGGTVNPSTFVKLSAVADRTLLPAGANDEIFGITGTGTNNFQYLNAALSPGGIAGQLDEIFMDGEPCLLLAGVGGWNPKDFLKSDANGAGVVGAVGLDNIGAQGLEVTLAGNYGKVVPWKIPAPGVNGPAGAFRPVVASTTLTVADGGTTVELSLVTSGIITLPPVSTLSAGWSVTLSQGLATTSGVGMIVAINAVLPDTAYIYGGGIAGPYVASKGLQNTQATSKIGDSVTVRFNGTNFLATAINGTWIKQP